MNDSEAKSSFLKQSITNYIMEISKLQADAEVIPLVPCSICFVKFSHILLPVLKILFSFTSFVTQAHAELKNERDFTLRKLFDRHNLGAVPTGSLSDDVASNLTNRIKLRLTDFDKDLQDKKVILPLFYTIHTYIQLCYVV